jgi:hypothetical protein
MMCERDFTVKQGPPPAVFEWQRRSCLLPAGIPGGGLAVTLFSVGRDIGLDVKRQTLLIVE